MEKQVIEFLALKAPFQNLYYLHEIYDKNLGKKFHKAIKKYLNKRDKLERKYYYFLTFTLKEQMIKTDPERVKCYIITRLQRPALEVVKASIVQELTQKGVPHWHCAVVSNKFIAKDRFKTYINKFGFVDISKNVSHSFETMIEYMSKSNVPEDIAIIY